MYVVHVAPISRGIKKEILTYFSSQALPEGSLIKVTLRARKVPALVLACENAADQKSLLRAKDFSLRKIHSQTPRSFLLPSFITAVRETADFHAASVGSTLYSLLPRILFDDPALGEVEKGGAKVCPTSYHDFFILQESADERMKAYRGMIREAFARSSSVFIAVPTVTHAEEVYSAVEESAEGHCFLLHGSLSPKKLTAAWRQAQKDKHPIVIVGTAPFLALPRLDMETIIMESESSDAYRRKERPFLDLRVFIEKFAHEHCARVILADTILRTETIWRHKSTEALEMYPITWRYSSPATAKLVDMKSYPNPTNDAVRILGDELEDVLNRVVSENLKVLLTTTRRGLYPHVTCLDCGTPVTCNTCHYPIVVYNDPRKIGIGDEDPTRVFVCHICGAARSAHETCRTCGSWRLKPLGIGLDAVALHLERYFPSAPRWVLSSETAPTRTKAKKIMKEFENAPAGVLLTTQMGIELLAAQRKRVDVTGIVSIDSLLSIPDLGVNEEAFRLITLLLLASTRECIVQTRQAQNAIFTEALCGRVKEFYKEEINVRREYEYPPFTTLIKLTQSGTFDAVRAGAGLIKDLLAPWKPSFYPAFVSRIRKKYVLNCLLVLPAQKGALPKDLLAALHALPPSVEIRINPESLL